MADVICMSCGEPWEADYLNHDGVWDEHSPNAPSNVLAEQELLVSNAERFERSNPLPDGVYIGSIEGRSWRSRRSAWLSDNGFYPAYPSAFYRAVVSGSGCPSCDWSKADGSRFDEALSAALDSAAFDGDPIDLLESFL
jgi:hypothetical protein